MTAIPQNIDEDLRLYLQSLTDEIGKLRLQNNDLEKRIYLIKANSRKDIIELRELARQD